MATFKLKNVESVLNKNIKEKLSGINKDKKILREIGTFSTERMKAFARKGKPLRDGKAGKFPPIAESTEKWRRYIAKYNKTHISYGKSGRRLNVTISGQLIEAIKFKIKSSLIEIFVAGRRLKYRGKNGKIVFPEAQEENSREVYASLLQISDHYKFLGLDEIGEKRIKNIIKRNLRRLLR